MFIVEWFYCPDGIIPVSGLTGLNNTHTHTHTHTYIYIIEQVLKAAFHKAAAVRPLTTHHENSKS